MTKHAEPSDDHRTMEILPSTNPIQLFTHWMNEAKQIGLKDPNAMTVATVDAAGEVHARIVLCKSWSDDGFIFYTNYDSQKGQDLGVNPRAAATFFWDKLARQIKITADVKRTSREQSVAYWNSRPRESQLSQYISRQSQEVASRAELERAWAQAEVELRDREIPCPEHWGGYVLVPKSIEFWLGQAGRLHDRHVYDQRSGHWTYRRLCP